MDNILRPNLDPHALARELSGKHLIGGAMVPAASGKTFEVINPATGEITGQAAYGEAADVDAAVGAAEQAQPDWARLVDHSLTTCCFLEAWCGFCRTTSA